MPSIRSGKIQSIDYFYVTSGTSTAGPSGGGGTPTAPPPKPEPPKTPPKRPPRRPRPRQEARVVVESVEVEVWPYMPSTGKAYGTPGRLLCWEWFTARLVVRARVEGGGGAPVAARLNVTIPRAPWYAYSWWRGSGDPPYMVAGRAYNETISVDSGGTHVYWLPLPADESWRARCTPGIYNFSVYYTWSNGDESGIGVASARVMLAGPTGPEVPGGYRGTRAVLYWVPTGTDRGVAVVALYWPDRQPVKWRPAWWLRHLASLGGIDLRPENWSRVERMLPEGARRLGVLEGLFDLTPDSVVLYANLSFSSIHIQGLEGTVELRFWYWFPNLTVRVAESMPVVYSLNWSAGQMRGRLKLVDWSRVKPLEGFIAVIVKTNSSVSTRWFLAEPYAVFELELPPRYEVWAVSLPAGRFEIYVNLRYGRILLHAEPFIPP